MIDDEGAFPWFDVLLFLLLLLGILAKRRASDEDD